MHKIAVYPGTFDPITLGHMDIIERALNVFDEVVIAVATSRSKKPMYCLEAREDMIHEAIKSMDRVRVVSFDSLLVDLCKKEKASVIIRGLRAVSDFEYEIQLSYANSSLDSTIESIFLMPTLERAFISSSVVRSIIEFDGRIDHLVPKEILPYLKENRCI